jgi:hypothetical protein
MTTFPEGWAAHARASSMLSQRDGLFYAEIAHPHADGRLRVALHGISDYDEAHKAVSLLTGASASGLDATARVDL